MLTYEEADDSLGDWWHYASVLLHEMIHAFLQRWANLRLPLSGKCLEGFGRSGHGFAWQDISLALETAANDPTLTGMKLDLNREHSFRLELSLW